MYPHTLAGVYQTPGGWTATCSCHNPDGEGVGRADFQGDTATEAVAAWEEHSRTVRQTEPSERTVAVMYDMWVLADEITKLDPTYKKQADKMRRLLILLIGGTRYEHGPFDPREGGGKNP
jgi:hypothetical protein